MMLVVADEEEVIEGALVLALGIVELVVVVVVSVTAGYHCIDQGAKGGVRECVVLVTSWLYHGTGNTHIH